MLSHAAPFERQRSTIEWLVAQPERIDLSVLVLPSGKDAWENAVEVLARIGSPRIYAHVPALLEWLKDLNWPGARTLFDLCRSLDRATLQPYFEAALKAARIEYDADWEDTLRDLADARGDLDKELRSWPPASEHPQGPHRAER